MPSSDNPRLPRERSSRRNWRGSLFHLARVGIFVAIIFLIRQQHVWYQAQLAGRDAAAVSLEQIRRFYPSAAELSDWDADRGGRQVVDSEGKSLGYFVQTSPQSDQVVGYSGSTNTLIAFDPDGRILGIEILSSGDTKEHVEDVLKDEPFMAALDGLTWEEAAERRKVDGVSGATLTSLAIAEGISHRLGGARPSLRFPNAITRKEIKPFFPDAAQLKPRAAYPAIVDILDDQQQPLGAAVRTSPAADDVMGYQGPTDTLVMLGADERVKGIALRRSYDNEPYVQYVRDDEYFLSRFNGMSLEQLAGLDPEEAEIEGISGATMTSMSIAYGLPKAAEAARVARQEPRRAIVFSARDFGTCVVVGLALIVTFSRLRRHGWLRIAFQAVLTVYLGFLNGDMISQALMVGWAQSGVPWRLAPGLVLMTAAALAVPIFTKKQTYCHHICPFGAAQQLVKRRVPWQATLPPPVSNLLQAVPAVLLIMVVATAILHLQINLAGIEPFDAFLFRIAGWSTITVASVGLIASLFVPMAYCRFGCPTGAVLNYLRSNARSGTITRRDVVAILLLLLAALLRWI